MLRFVAPAAALAAAGCHPIDRPAEPAHAKLVVLVVLDQWPEWAFEAKRSALDGGGFARLLSEGEWRVGEHPSAATLTAPGHALFGTGAPSAVTGILANEWWRRDLGKRLASVEDEAGAPTAKWLRVPGIAEAIARAHPDAKAVSVSLKDRSAILSLGHGGVPIWYDRTRAAFTSFTPPPWLAAMPPIEPRTHAPWLPLDAARLAALSGVTDDRAGEVGEKKLGRVFPHAPDSTGDAADAVFAQPLGNTLVLETARAAIAGEQLGADDEPDLLVVSLSAHDYVGHGWGQESWEMWDAEMRLDAELADFLAALDRDVGSWAMIVTSDHGASPMAAGGGRIVFEDLHAAAERAAAEVLGEGPWIADAKYPTVYFTPALLALPADRRAAAEAAVLAALRRYPGVDRAERTADIAGDCDRRRGDDHALCLALDPERSGELAWLPAAHWIIQDADEPLATAHGSLNPYDRRVPVILLPPGRTRHPPRSAPAPGLFPMTEIAPTLARWLEVPPPTDLLPGRSARVALP